jgi:hypothetical protein
MSGDHQDPVCPAIQGVLQFQEGLRAKQPPVRARVFLMTGDRIVGVDPQRASGQRRIEQPLGLQHELKI